MKQTSDFASGSLYRHILSLSIPLIIAQFVSLAYSIVDRIYIGHLPGEDSMAMTGLGLTFPLVTIINAFTLLFSTGAVPLFSIARGRNEKKQALFLLNTTFVLLGCTSLVLTALGYLFMKPVLTAFGASASSWPYARDYLLIYLIGTPFAMLSSGLNGFISAQGFGKTAMLSTVFGAVCNILLDPIFIFGLKLNIQGAALATVISQALSAFWVLAFLFSSRSLIRLSFSQMKVRVKETLEIVQLGLTGFMVQGTNFAVQIAGNQMLQAGGGDLYVGVMTLLTSVRDVTVLPVMGLNNGAQPVLGYNYGAGRPLRVWKGIRFLSVLSFGYTAVMWAVVLMFSKPILSLFTSDPALIEASIPSLKTYFFGFVFMAMQFSGQAVFQGLGQAKYAVFFSIFRKIIIVVPLTLLLPSFMGIQGVFAAEPVSNIIGGTVCYLTMLAVMKRLLKAPASL